MFINKEKCVLDTDYVLGGFTFRDILDVANANGEPFQHAFSRMLSEAVANARETIALNEVELMRIQQKEREGKD